MKGGGEWDEAQWLAAQLNEWVFPFSKFGAAPHGCVERVNYDPTARAQFVVLPGEPDRFRALLGELTGLGPRLTSPFTGDPPVVNGAQAPTFERESGQIGLLPDTRDDVLVPRVLPIPEGEYEGPLGLGIPVIPRNLLSRTETNLLNSAQGKVGSGRALPWATIPNNVLFRVQSKTGLVAQGTRLEVYQLVGGSIGSRPAFTSNVDEDGLVLMQVKRGMFSPDGSNAWLLAVVYAGGSRSATWIPAWRLWDEVARGNKTTAMIEVPFKPQKVASTQGENFAKGRLVADSGGRFPAQLNVVVDGDETTALDLAGTIGEYWIEIDLGRDRQIGRIELAFEGEAWKQFQIVGYKSGQSMADALVLVTENRGGGSLLKYEVRSDRTRYVRAVVSSDAGARLAEVRLTAG